MPQNLAHGSIFKNIAIFSLPYLLAYFLQTLYGLADLFIIGQFESAEAITAVAVGSQVMHFLTVIIVGFAMGTTVLIGRAFGAKNFLSISRIAGNSILLLGTASILLTASLLFFCSPIVSLLKTPPEAIDNTTRYLRICFAGIPGIIAYNFMAAIFRGMGESKRPMYFIAFACLLNIALDYIFIGGFHWSAAGAAAATILAQTASFLMALKSVRKSVGFSLSLKDFRPHKTILRGICSVGFPIAIQDGFIQVSFLFITMIANSRGMEIAAAVGIVEKIISFLFLVPSAMLSTISAIASQSFGAKDFQRARITLGRGMGITACVAFIFAIAFQFISENAVALFTEDPAIVRFGTEYLRMYVFDCIFASVHFCFSGYFCARGLSIISFVHNAFSIALVRIPGTALAAKFSPDTLLPMGMAAPAGSLFSVIFCFAVFKIYKRKLDGG